MPEAPCHFLLPLHIESVCLCVCVHACVHVCTHLHVCLHVCVCLCECAYIRQAWALSGVGAALAAPVPLPHSPLLSWWHCLRLEGLSAQSVGSPIPPHPVFLLLHSLGALSAFEHHGCSQAVFLRDLLRDLLGLGASAGKGLDSIPRANAARECLEKPKQTPGAAAGPEVASHDLHHQPSPPCLTESPFTEAQQA